MRVRSPALAALLLVVAACSGGTSNSPSAPASSQPSGGTGSPAATNAPATPGASASEAAVASGSPGACPSQPVDLAAVRDAAKARTAIGCFGSQDLTFTAYVPTTDGLGGVPASKMTPTWLADPWTGVILQPEGTTVQDQDVWFVVRLAPGLGACSITDPTARTCPFGDSLDTTVSVTGHFDDPAAQTCRSKPLKAGGDAGPSKKQMIATCRDQFVVTAVSPA